MSLPAADTGTNPKSIKIDPSGQYAFLVNSDDNTVSQYWTGSAGGGGFNAVETPVAPGQTTTVGITPDVGYTLNRTTGCNGTLSGSTYTTGSVFADCTVKAFFTQ